MRLVPTLLLGLLAAAPAAAQEPVVFRTAELEVTLPAGFGKPVDVSDAVPADVGALAIRAYGSIREEDGVAAIIMVTRLFPGPGTVPEVRPMTLRLFLLGMASGQEAELVDESPVEEAPESFAVTARMRPRDTAAPVHMHVRAGMSRTGVPMIVTLLFSVPRKTGTLDGTPEDLARSLASLRLREPVP